jgi:hypothetical protein
MIDYVMRLIRKLDLPFWQSASREDLALYWGLFALGSLFILGVYFRVRLRCPRPPGHRDSDDHQNPLK